MAYRKRRRAMYDLHRLSSLNIHFRKSWETGISKALSDIDKLRKEGWIFDVKRGALTEKEADLFVEVAERMGKPTIRVPVAEWTQQKIEFVGYRNGTIQPSASGAPAEVRKSKKPRKDPFKVWEDLFYKGKGISEQIQERCVLNPDRTMALLASDSTHSGLLEVRDESIRSPDSISELDYRKINKAIRAARKAGQPKPKWIRIGDHTFNVEYVKKAMRTLSTMKADGYYRSEKGPLVVKDKTPSITWSVIIAPGTTSTESEVVDISQVNAT